MIQKLLYIYYQPREISFMKSMGWWVAMGITVALVWVGTNYLMPFK